MKNSEKVLEKTAETEKSKTVRVALQEIHRNINSAVIFIVVLVLIASAIYLPDKLKAKQRATEITRIMEEEGMRLKVYKDTLGVRTVGFGHRVLKQEKYVRITPDKAIQLLQQDYTIASDHVDKAYPWADKEVRLILINMSYQLGANRLGKFVKMLAALESEKYTLAAAELLDSRLAVQTPSRAGRLAGRVLELKEDFFYWE